MVTQHCPQPPCISAEVFTALKRCMLLRFHWLFSHLMQGCVSNSRQRQHAGGPTSTTPLSSSSAWSARTFLMDCGLSNAGLPFGFNTWPEHADALGSAAAAAGQTAP